MLVREIIEMDNKKQLIRLENGEEFPLYKGEVRRFALREEEEIAEQDLTTIYQEILKKRVRERAFYLLQSMDKTESELRKKLKQGKYPDCVIEPTLEFLKQYSYVDDRRYVENYIRTHSKRKSRRSLLQELSLKGIERELLQEFSEEMNDNRQEREQQLIYQLLEKKHFQYEKADIKERNRILAFFMRKGFEMEDIQHCMRNYGKV